MPAMNRIFLMGNLTSDPVSHETPSGAKVTDMRLAVNQKYKTKEGAEKSDTVFVDIVVWGSQAENSAKYLRKGSLAMVEGRLQYDEWEKDGQKHSKLRVRADSIQFLNRAAKNTGPGSDDDPLPF